MRIFNRLIVVLLLVGLFVAGVYAVVYSFELLGYTFSTVFDGFSAAREALQGFVGSVENGQLTPAVIAVLVLVAVVGLILLVLELKPRKPRRVRMERGTYIARRVVADEVDVAARQTSNVLGSTTRVKTRRRAGAKVRLSAHVRRGEDTKAMRSELKESVQRRLSEAGVPLSRLKLRLTESDPRTTDSRVK